VGSEADNDRMHIAASNFTSGHISHALMNFNRALIEMAHDRSMVDVATQLDRGLNRLQNEWLFGQSDRSLGEVDQFQRMMLSEVQGERKQEFLSSSALASLVRLDPMVLNQKRLIDGGYTPGTELSADLQKSATKVHKKLRSAFSSVEAKGDRVVELAAELIYIVRSNIAHGEKTPFGDDIAKSARDESVCSATVPVQWLLTDILLNSPTNRLLVYGSLAPGENNHAIVANLQGSWQDCVVRGTLREKQGLRELIWNPTGGEVPAKTFRVN
jgi:hypothetical protein